MTEQKATIAVYRKQESPAPAQRITMRLRPCRCGCKGRDPLHARTLRRTVRDICKVYGLAADKAGFTIEAAGTITVGGETVSVVCESFCGHRPRWYRADSCNAMHMAVIADCGHEVVS